MKFFQLKFELKIFAIAALISVSQTVAGQNTLPVSNSSLSRSANNNASSLVELQSASLKKQYSQEVEAPKELINGKEYEPYYTRSPVRPLLYPEKTRTASIITNTRRYDNLTLDYDTFLDEVVYTDTSMTINYRFPQIALNTDIVEAFNLYFGRDSAIFKYFGEPECAGRNIDEGFFEIAYTGDTQFIIKHMSTYYMRQAINNYKYSPKTYLSKGGPFVRIKSSKDLLNFFGDKSDEMKVYIHSAKIKVRKASIAQMIRILKYYDSL